MSELLGRKAIVIRRWEGADARLKIGMEGTIVEVRPGKIPFGVQFPSLGGKEFAMRAVEVVVLKPKPTFILIPKVEPIEQKQPQLPWC